MRSSTQQALSVSLWCVLVMAAYWFAGENHAMTVFWVGTILQVCLAIFAFINGNQSLRNSSWWYTPLIQAVLILILNQYFVWLGWNAELIERLTVGMICKEIIFWMRDRLR